MIRKLSTFLVGLFLFAAPWVARADEFVNVDPSKVNKPTSAPLFVVISYSAIWLVVVFFAFLLWRRQSAVREELQRAQARLDELTEDAADKGK